MRKLNQRGSFLVFLTLGFALVGTFIGFAVDFGRAYLEKARVSRLVDGAALAAAKVLKGQVAFESDAARAACDSMLMNGAQVAWSGGNTCSTTSGAPVTATVSFFNLPVPGGPPLRAVRIIGSEPVPTTFLRFLGWMAPGDYSSINVVAQAEAGPERPLDLMLVLDRSGSMTSADGSGQAKIAALQTAVNAFLGFQGTFSANDRIGMISFSSRGCGVNGSDTTAATCSPDAALDYATSSNISALQGKVSALNAVGGTNTMEALRTARAPLAAAFADPARATTRKAVLLVTDGQPTFFRREDVTRCKQEPLNNSTLPFNPGNLSGCVMGVGSYPIPGAGTTKAVYDFSLASAPSSCWASASGTGCTNAGSIVATNYLNFLRCSRSITGCQTNGAMFEANLLRNCGFTNDTCSAGGAHDLVVFVIAIGQLVPTMPQQSLDANAKCLLARIANATDILDAATGVVDTMTTNCNNKFTTSDTDTHADLVEGWPCGTGPCIDTTQQKGKVYTVDVSGDVNAQLNVVFQEIAQLLKLRLVL